MIGPQKNNQCANLNSIERFNLYPELLLAGAYRFLHTFDLIRHYCFQVKRDPPTNPIAIAINPNIMANLSQLRKWVHIVLMHAMLLLLLLWSDNEVLTLKIYICCC